MVRHYAVLKFIILFLHCLNVESWRSRKNLLWFRTVLEDNPLLGGSSAFGERKDSNAAFDCWPHERYERCGPRADCERTCDNYRLPPSEECQFEGRRRVCEFPRCLCVDGYARGSDRRCHLLADCQRYTTDLFPAATTDTVMTELPTTIYTTTTQPPVTSFLPVSVTTETYEPTTSTTTATTRSTDGFRPHPSVTDGRAACNDDEVYYECGLYSAACEERCFHKGVPPPCPLICGTHRCLCKQGFVRHDTEHRLCIPRQFCLSGTSVIVETYTTITSTSAPIPTSKMPTTLSTTKKSECLISECPRDATSGLICSGNGWCVCARCHCDNRWTGHNCDCTGDKSGCRIEESATICSQHGTCVCGKCQCSIGWRGMFCEESADETATSDPQSSCGANSLWRRCASLSVCQPSCVRLSDDECPPVCAQESACECLPGYIWKNEQRTECVRPTECIVSNAPAKPDHGCAVNEVWEECRCEERCDGDVIGGPNCGVRECTTAVKTCICRLGFRRHQQGFCVPAVHCQGIVVTTAMGTTTSAAAMVVSGEKGNDTGVLFTAKLEPDAANNTDDSAPSQPIDGCSGVGEVTNVCGGDCEPLCIVGASDVRTKVYCSLQCLPPACVCVAGYARHPNGSCVAADFCQTVHFPLLTENTADNSASTAPPTQPSSTPTSVTTSSQCGANETFDPCGRDCEQLCVPEPTDEMSPRTYIYCSAECRAPGVCVCDVGLARRKKDGACVRPFVSDGCEKVYATLRNEKDECKWANERWESCDRKCELQCGEATLACSQNCQSSGACICLDGYARHSSGDCVKPEQCTDLPTETCKENEHFEKECSTKHCEASCLSYRRTSRPCALLCGPATCVCNEGYVRDVRGTLGCIRAVQCRNRVGLPLENGTTAMKEQYAVETCGANSEFKICRQHDPPTCSNPLGNGLTVCVNPGECVCKPGFVRNENYFCIPTSECSKQQKVLSRSDLEKSTQCNHNERFDTCGVYCEVNCTGFKISGPSRLHICPRICLPAGCTCEEGLVRDDTTGECIPPFKCHGLCGENEHFEVCSNTYCEPSCGETENSCTSQCGPPSCICDMGFARNSNGYCIPAIDCPANPIIPPLSLTRDRLWIEEKGLLDIDPEVHNVTSALGLLADIMPVSEVAFGKFQLDIDSFKSPEEHSIERDYGRMVFYPATELKATKSVSWYPLTIGVPETKPFVKDEMIVWGVECPLNEVYDDCGAVCEAECVVGGTPNESAFEGGDVSCRSVTRCSPSGGCRCRPGYARDWRSRSCVHLTTCKDICPSNERLVNCGPYASYCIDTCQTAAKPCPRMCGLPTCICQDGYIRDETTMQCIPREDCPGTSNQIQSCPANQQWTECGPFSNAGSCRETCDSYQFRSNNTLALCPEVCGVASCVCNDGYVLNSEGDCIKPDQCLPMIALKLKEGPGRCPTHEHWDVCGRVCERRCYVAFHPMHVCPDGVCAEAACTCDDGLYRLTHSKDDNNTSCVPLEQCPGLCAQNETFSICGPSASRCEPMCGQTPPRPCSSECGAPKCLCKPGFIRESASKKASCIAVDECDVGNDTRSLLETVEDVNLRLVELHMCANISERLSKCGPPSEGCVETCVSSAPQCPLRCGAPVCVCQAGFVRRNDVVGAPCVRREDCGQLDLPPEANECTANEVYSYCGYYMKDCEPTCGQDHAQCPLACGPPGCQCRQGFVRGPLGSCILSSLCPKTGRKTALGLPIDPESFTADKSDYDCSAKLSLGTPCSGGHSTVNERKIRWYYNSAKRYCLPFLYAGCGANGNNFATKALCQQACVDSVLDGRVCSSVFSATFRSHDPLRPSFSCDGGACPDGFRCRRGAFAPECCNTTVEKWNEGAQSEECLSGAPVFGRRRRSGFFEPFLLDDCLNSANICPRDTDCERINPHFARCCLRQRPIASGVFGCHLPKDAGRCPQTSRARLRWFFHAEQSLCLAFKWFGCGGDDDEHRNVFETKRKCENSCQRDASGVCQGTNVKMEYVGTCGGVSCETGFNCKQIGSRFACCNVTVEAAYNEAFSSKCSDGSNAFNMGGRRFFEPLLAENCKDLICPVGHKCLDVKRMFGKCCERH